MGDHLKPFLLMAKYYANEFSDDPDTRVGAIFIDKDKNVLSMGCNRSPQVMKLNKENQINMPKYIKPEKYLWIEHAERNAIFNAGNNGVSLEGSTCIVTLPPCVECTRAIIQSKVKHIITFIPSGENRWVDIFTKSKELLDRSGITVELIDITQSDVNIDISKYGWEKDKLKKISSGGGKKLRRITRKKRI